MMSVSAFFFLLALAYIAGSVNVSIILFKILGKGDPRGYASKNPGVTNVYRKAGVYWALAVLILETGKSFTVALIAGVYLLPQYIPWIGIALVMGNRYPVFHGFKGGKGVANYLGFTAALCPVGSLMAAAIWGEVYAFGKTPYLASFAMIIMLGVFSSAAAGYHLMSVGGNVIAVIFIVFSHRSNIRQTFKFTTLSF